MSRRMRHLAAGALIPMVLASYVTLGPTGLRVSPLCLGAMTFGSDYGCDRATAWEILDLYREAGGNFVDTANGYGEGRSEEYIGEYIGRRAGLRDSLVIATKFAGNLFPDDPNGGGAGRKAIFRQIEHSLRRLRTDYIDLYWLHNHDRHTPIEETMAALDDLVSSGKVRYIGLSDTPAWAVARAATICQFRGWTPVAAIQVEYSLLQRSVEGELFGVANELNLGVTPWGPLASGVLSGKYTRDDRSPADAKRATWNTRRLDEKTFNLLDVLHTIATELDASAAAVALAWVRHQHPVTSTIIGARTTEQLKANLASLDVTLSAEHLSELDALTRPRLDFPAEFLETVAPNWQQAGATINGLDSVNYRARTTIS